MLVRTLGLSASLALAAHAVLIPSTTALKKVADDQVVPLQAFGEKTLVQFACPGCPYARFDEAKNMVWSTTEVENSIIYEFSTGRYHDRLALNGVQLFPPAFDEPEPIFVQQVPSDITPDNMAEFLKSNPDRRPLRITQMVFAFNSAQTVSENGNELLVMHLTVSGLEGQSVSPQLIRISVLKDISGRLFIAEVKGKTDPAEVQAEEEKQCKNWPMLCKWRDIIEDKLSALKNSMNKSGKPKGCNKGRPGAGRVDNRPHHINPGHIRPAQRPPVHDPPFDSPHGAPPGHPPHRHHHHSKMHRIAHMVSHLIMTVIVPIFVGVAAGVATYMAGLLIGMAVAFIWIKIRGTSHGQYDRVALDEEDADDDDDVPPYTPTNKEYFVVEQSAEAGLESPPVYEEVAEKESAN